MGKHRGQPIKRELIHGLMPYDKQLRFRVAVGLGLLAGIGGYITHWDRILWPLVTIIFCVIHLETCRILWALAHSRGKVGWYSTGYADGLLGRPRLLISNQLEAED